jgi:hypothetical protein
MPFKEKDMNVSSPKHPINNAKDFFSPSFVPLKSDQDNTLAKRNFPRIHIENMDEKHMGNFNA